MAADQAVRIRRTLARATPLRVRITAVAVLAVGIALLVGSVVFVSLLGTSLVDTSRSAAELRANSVASEVKSASANDVPVQFNVGGEEFVQILDADGVVRSSSKNARGQASLATSGKSSDVRSVPFDDDRFVVVQKSVTTPQGRRIVVAGRSVDHAYDATDTVTGLLLIGYPLMLLVVGAMAWFSVGGALAPVDRMRREVDDISAEELQRRVFEPPHHDEIGRLARTMNHMLTRLDDAQKKQRQFVSDAAHELRSPIAAIKQYAEVAATYPEHLDTQELISTVQSEANQLERLTTTLLQLARLDEHLPDHSAEVVDLDDLVLNEVQRLKQTTSLSIDAGSVSAGRVGGEMSLLAQMVRNLVDNATRHAATTIAFTLAEHEDSVTMRIEDDGPGVPAAERERIFERFVRLDEARARDDGGSGLGLAIVREVVAGYSGSVVVTDGQLGGACFVVTLPRLNDEP